MADAGAPLTPPRGRRQRHCGISHVTVPGLQRFHWWRRSGFNSFNDSEYSDCPWMANDSMMLMDNDVSWYFDDVSSWWSTESDSKRHMGRWWKWHMAVGRSSTMLLGSISAHKFRCWENTGPIQCRHPPFQSVSCLNIERTSNQLEAIRPELPNWSGQHHRCPQGISLAARCSSQSRVAQNMTKTLKQCWTCQKKANGAVKRILIERKIL